VIWGRLFHFPLIFFDADSIARTVARSNVVVNLIGRDAETRHWNFHDTHVKASHRLAQICKEAGVPKFIHVSALGAHPDSESQFFASKAEGEEAVRDFYPNAVILRPAPIFGESDRLICRLRELVWRWQKFPIINNGDQKIQPVYVLDVAAAILNSVTTEGHEGKIYHLTGPDVFTYRELIRLVVDYSYRHNFHRTRNVPLEIALILGKLREYHLPNLSWLYNKDSFLQQQYDLVAPTHPDTLSLKDLHVGQTPLVPTIVDILRPFYRNSAPDRFEATSVFLPPI